MFWSQKRFSYSLNLDLKQKCHFFGSRLKVTEGYVIGGVNTTSALSLPAGFVYLQQTAAKTNSNTLNNTFVLLVGQVKHLLRAKHNAGMLWKLGREVKIFNPLFFPLFRIQRDFFCNYVSFYTLAIKFIQPFEKGVKTVHAFVFARQSGFTKVVSRRMTRQDEFQWWSAYKAEQEGYSGENFFHVLT